MVVNSRNYWLACCLRQLSWLSFLPFGLLDRIFRYVFPPDRQSDYRFSCSLGKRHYQGEFSNFIDWSVFFHRGYERYILKLLRDISARYQAAVFLDIGANLGQHSLWMTDYSDSVHSVEPWRSMSEKIEEKKALNQIESWVIHPFALGDSDGEAEFFLPDNENLGTGSLISSEKDTRDSITITVKDASSYIPEQIGDIDIIKIDVEGYEPEVLKGLKMVLREFRPVVVFELSESTQKTLDSFYKLEGMFPDNYLFYKIKMHSWGRGYGLEPLGEEFKGEHSNILAVPLELKFPQ